MKIFATGDFHGDSLLAKKLAKQAKEQEADLVVICGDLSNFGQNTDNLIGPFLEHDQKVMFIPGNHDSFATADFLASFYGVTNIHGQGKAYGDIGVFGCGGANVGVERLTEEEIYEQLKEGFEKIKYSPKKVMVTHVHPTGSAMEKMTAFFPGSTGVRKAIDTFKPDVLLCCHVHEAAGLEEKIAETTVMNVCRQAKIFDI